MPEPEEPEQRRKIFVGSLVFKSDEKDLKEFYGQFGEITDCVVMKDKQTGKSRGFGFVTFQDVSMVDEAMKNRPHTINGRQCQPKRAVPREDAGNPTSGAAIQKIFIGGIKDKPITKEDIDEYFGKYGTIKDSVIMVEKGTGKPRGFAFVEFDDYDPVDKIILEKTHKIKDFSVEVKKATPRNADAGPGPMMGGGGRGGFGGGYGMGGGGMPGGYGGGYGMGFGGGGGYGGGGYAGGFGGGPMGGGGYGMRGGYGGGGGFGQNYGQNFGGGPMRGGFMRGGGGFGGGGGYGGGGPYGGRM